MALGVTGAGLAVHPDHLHAAGLEEAFFARRLERFLDLRKAFLERAGQALLPARLKLVRMAVHRVDDTLRPGVENVLSRCVFHGASLLWV